MIEELQLLKVNQRLDWGKSHFFWPFLDQKPKLQSGAYRKYKIINKAYEDLKRNTPVSGQIFLFLLFLSFLSTFLSTLLLFLEKYEVNNVNISAAFVEKCSNNYQHRRITKTKNKSLTFFPLFLPLFLPFFPFLPPLSLSTACKYQTNRTAITSIFPFYILTFFSSQKELAKVYFFSQQ